MVETRVLEVSNKRSRGLSVLFTLCGSGPAGSLVPKPHAFRKGWVLTNGQQNIIMAETTSGLETEAVEVKAHNKFQTMTVMISGPGRRWKGRLTLPW